MPDTTVPDATAPPSILLVEPGTSGYSERAVQLGKSKYSISRAEDAGEIFTMRKAFTFAVAVLSDAVGFFALRASAQLVRAHWPKARIVILGRTPAQFEDHLYDEALAHTASEAALLANVHTLSEEYWARRGESFSAWINSVSRAPRPALAWPESDPSKTSPSLFLTGDTRSWANSVRRFHGSRLG